ncbi:4'-phosphopantetheinyl transferase [Buchnera aphidicola (Schlechtendalia chinensis)]|uniref:Holo-[acyl-carrier-protein] synthase n=1 Tax=Buchnera aphidicola subsp. Schlechtendalia chinensis TaxID=118110 RepID=A0A172WDL6_BUCSC|nr:holo-ACP synthase [Buchnera aphidicola]ANF17025.1 4'-phosphopantetheinyl transferase [Buchnera aphidicola (Schlechtendalia chinensis)]
MSIFGIGIDILSIIRIKSIIRTLGKKFAKRILSRFELKEYQRSTNPVYFLAKHFSVKESASKALGTGIRNGIKFNNFELRHNKLGKPYLRFLKKAKIITKNLGVHCAHVSISDEKLYILTIVIFEK